MASKQVFTLTGSSSASASTTTIVTTLGASLLGYDWFSIDATLTGATGGTLDVYIQRKVTDNVWVDWIHFPQIAGGGSGKYSAMSGADKTIHAVAIGTDAGHGTPALAANTVVGGHPGSTVRVVTVTGAGVSVAGTFAIYLGCWKSDK